ncbi:type II secretion system protein N [Acinetobacter larvae]|uniref:Type II secretion system protein N n=1 Tax=Acinetobacter larvae TaxID=1789224 RepID=A0A1B2M3E9_9GAMM|nr:type II secretion system protein N [Acinetobacter larvae]AOA59543.1 general secretion pathway protein [Acinetobacter larvae]
MNKKTKQMMWCGGAVSAFLFFVLLQVPASWLMNKFYNDQHLFENVSGNIWQGQADWQKGQLNGSISWKIRPLDLFLLRFAADIQLNSHQSNAAGIVGYTLNQTLKLKQLKASISPETLAQMSEWQWPANAIQLQDVQFDFKKGQGFSHVAGDLQWGGGELLYQFSQREDRMNVPALQAQLQDQEGKLLIPVVDRRQQKMANLAIDPTLMLDVQLSQRLLMNVASYQGKAGLDSMVLSSRQPLLQGGQE